MKSTHRLIASVQILLLGLTLFAWPVRSLAAEAPIINGKTKMAPGEKQVLSIMNYQTGNTYNWSIKSGGGTLGANAGERVTYTAPATNPDCDLNPTIEITDAFGNTRAFHIAINGLYNLEWGVYYTFDNDYCEDRGVWGWVCYYDQTEYRCDDTVKSKIQRAATATRFETCSTCYNKPAYPPGGPFPKMTVNQHLAISPADRRNEFMKSVGCCPEGLLPNYEPPKKSPSNVDFGKDPDETCLINSKVGNPISIYNGNNFEAQIDLSFPSPGSRPFMFKRYYNSRSGIIANMGYGWTHNYWAHLTPAYNYNGGVFLRILDETGRGIYFENLGNGYYAGAFKEKTHVTIEDGNYVWYRLDGSRFEFSPDRKLHLIREADGGHKLLNYDAGGRLYSVVDEGSGRMLIFQYNANGRIEAIVGPITAEVVDGVWVRYGYDTVGNPVSVVYADGSGFEYEYSDPNDVHNLTAKRNKAGNLLSSWSYDTKDRAVYNFTRDGNGVAIDYVDENEVRVTDPYGTTRTYSIWNLDGRKKITDIAGPPGCNSCSNEIKRIEYDSQGRAIEVEYTTGLINQYGDFDSRGNARIFKKSVGSPYEKTITYTFHPYINATLSRTEPSLLDSGSKITIWDYDNDLDDSPNQNPTRRLYRKIERGFTKDMHGNLIPYENITAYTYNGKGQVLSVDGPRPGSQDAITFEYDTSSGDLLAVTWPLAGTIHFSEYDAAGQAGQIIDENESITRYTYDGRGRLKKVVRAADNATSTYSYNIAGDLASVKDPDGISFAFGYDTIYGRLIQLLDLNGNYLYFGYDGQGNRTEQVIFNSLNEALLTKRFDYQGAQHPGKLWKEIQPDNSYTEYNYDIAGNIQAVTNPAGATTFFSYDPNNRLSAVIQPGSVQTSFTYDKNDNLTGIRDAENNTTLYFFDDHGRLLKTVSPDTDTTTYTYDAAGNILSKTDAAGHTVQFSYDDLNRLTAIHFPDSAQDVFYTYDQGRGGKGRLSRVQDPSGTVWYEYDDSGRLAHEKRLIRGVEFSTHYTYTPADRIFQVVYPGGRTVKYHYDAAGQTNKVTSVFDGEETVLSENISHVPFGPISSMRLGNGLSVTNSFDQLYRLKTSQAGTVYSRTFTYNRAGNIIGIENLMDSNRSHSFVYDDLNRLSVASGSYGNIGFSYDRVGNRLSKTLNGSIDIYSYVPGTNKLFEADDTTFFYDANGNTTAWGAKSLTYNQNNRLIRAAENETVLGEYIYNAMGQRMVKTAGDETTLFCYDSQGRLIAEANESAEIINEYIWMEGRLLASIKNDKQRIEAMVDIDPDTLNLDSQGSWITARIELPEGHPLSDIDPASITLNEAVYAERVQVEDFDNDGTPTLMANFSREQVSSTLQPGEAVEVFVAGEADKFRIGGSDIIRVISRDSNNINRQTIKDSSLADSNQATGSLSKGLFFYHLDHLGTPRAMTNQERAVVWQADYLPFGKVDIAVDIVGNNVRFPGQYYDHETGLNYNYHRYYDPKTGRYLTPDPIGMAGTDPNLYGYVLNNPINAIDPDGRSVFIATGIIGGISGAFSGFATGLQSGNFKAAIAGGIIGGFAGAIVGTFNPFGSSAIGVLLGNISAGFVGGAAGGYASAAIDPDPCSDNLRSATKGALIGAMSGAVAAPITYFSSLGVAGSGYAPWINASAVSVVSESVSLPAVLSGTRITP